MYTECGHNCKSIRKEIQRLHNIIKCEECYDEYVQCQVHLCPEDDIKCSCKAIMKRKNKIKHDEVEIECGYNKYGCFELIK